MRRSVHGPQASATAESRQTFPVPPGIQKLRLNLSRPSDLTIIATDRDDLAAQLSVSARGYEQGETKDAAAAAHLTVEPSGDTIVIANAWSDRREGQRPFITQVTITLTIPRRLQVNLQPHVGQLAVKDAASVEAPMSRGDTRITGTAGEVKLTHIGGTLELAGGTALKLSTRNSHGEISGFTGPASVEGAGSRLTLRSLDGPLDLEGRNTDFTLEKIDTLKPPLRINLTGGELRVDGLRVETRIDGRNADITVGLAAAAPVTIDNLGSIVVTAPPDGYTLDAVATEGRITSDDSSITATPSDGGAARAGAKIRGGGPPLTLRSTRGRIDIRHAAPLAGK